MFGNIKFQYQLEKCFFSSSIHLDKDNVWLNLFNIKTIFILLSPSHERENEPFNVMP